MNAICEKSLYNICTCKQKYHLPLTLPLYDGHCHVDLFFKYDLNKNDFDAHYSHGRKMVFIDNRHHHHRWFANYDLDNPNVQLYTTYGIHPKYLPSNFNKALSELHQIIKNQDHLNTSFVGIGECGLDDTSVYSYDDQLFIFKSQINLARQFQIPLVVHGRGLHSYASMLNEMQLNLDQCHRIHWHCVNPKTDLNIISKFINYFHNSFIEFNGSVIASNNDQSQTEFNNWLIKQQNVLDRIILETDFPFLRPTTLDKHQYNPISVITIVAQTIVNILRTKNLNATKVIDISNKNIQRMYGIQ